MAGTSNDSPVWGLRPGGEQHWGGATPGAASSLFGGASRGPQEQLALVLAQARQHASMQRLAAHYEEWESSLRREAEERMGGFRPLQRFIEASGTAEDWQLLRRVKSTAPAFGGGAMKRSASEGALTDGTQHHQQQQHAHGGHGGHGGGGGGGGAHAAGAGGAPRVHLRQEWDPLGAAGAAAGAGLYGAPHDAAPRRASTEGPRPGSPDAGEAAAAQQPRFPRATTAPALHDVRSSEEEDDEEFGDAPGAAAYAARARARMGSPLARPASAGAWAGGAGSPDELGGRQLEAMAARLLQQSRAAIQNAHAAVQETAINCSQNLQTLSALFSGSNPSLSTLGGGAGGGAGADGQLALAPWGAADRAAAAAAAAAAISGDGATPWEAIPRYLRLTAEGLAGGSGGAAGAGAAGAEAGEGAAGAAAGGPPAVYRQLAEYFDRLEEDRARRRRARQGGAYSSLKEPGRNVAIVTTASLPWCALAAAGRRLRASPPATSPRRAVRRHHPLTPPPPLPPSPTPEPCRMTGTAVNPLLRAAYLANEGEPEGEASGRGGDAAGASASGGGGKRRHVTLLLPWLNKSDQERVFPGAVTFDSPDDQEAFVREWAQKRTGLPCNFAVKFYPGRYAPEKGARAGRSAAAPGRAAGRPCSALILAAGGGGGGAALPAWG
jgi:hypothetical protein